MNNTDIMRYAFEEHDVRIIDQNGDAWFILKDVLSAIGRKGSRSNEAKSSIEQGLGDEHVTTVPIQDAVGRMQQSVIVDESAITFLVAQSRSEKGKRLNRWIHGEVLPSIRKTGNYQIPLTREQQIAQALVAATEVMEEQKQTIEYQSKKIEEDIPKVEYYESVGSASGLMTIGEAIKSMNIENLGRNKAMALLRSLKILQSSSTYWNQPYQSYINQGYFQMKQKLIPTGQMVPTTLVTPKGHQWLYKKLTN